MIRMSSATAPTTSSGTTPSGTAARVLDWASAQGLATPTALLAVEPVRAGVAHLREQLPGARISYSTKANSMPRLVDVLHPLVDEFNVTNLVHLAQLTALGVSPDRIQFLHPVVTPATLDAVLAHGVTRFVVDDQRGVGLLARAGRPLTVTVRVRPPALGESAASVVRFGCEPDSILGLARAVVDAGHSLESLSFFVGTAKDDTDGTAPYLGGISSLSGALERVENDGITVGGINIGGGFPGSRRVFHRRHPEFFPVIAAELRARFGTDRTVTCEPGRYLAEPSGLVIASVIAERFHHRRRLVHLDVSGFGGLFETSFIDPGSPPELLTARTAADAGGLSPATVIGPVMDSFDVVVRDALLPRVADRDLVLIPNVGAYTWGYSTTTEGVTHLAVVELPPDVGHDVAGMWHP